MMVPVIPPQEVEVILKKPRPRADDENRRVWAWFVERPEPLSHFAEHSLRHLIRIAGTVVTHEDAADAYGDFCTQNAQRLVNRWDPTKVPSPWEENWARHWYNYVLYSKGGLHDRLASFAETLPGFETLTFTVDDREVAKIAKRAGRTWTIDEFNCVCRWLRADAQAGRFARWANGCLGFRTEAAKFRATSGLEKEHLAPLAGGRDLWYKFVSERVNVSRENSILFAFDPKLRAGLVRFVASRFREFWLCRGETARVNPSSVGAAAGPASQLTNRTVSWSKDEEVSESPSSDITDDSDDALLHAEKTEFLGVLKEALQTSAELASESTPSTGRATSEGRRALLECLKHLDDVDLKILYMTFDNEYTDAEIVQAAFGTRWGQEIVLSKDPENLVKQRRFRALKQLRKCLTSRGVPL